jgi:hypothetical protein
LRAKQSKAKQSKAKQSKPMRLDCFVAALLAMTLAPGYLRFDIGW